MKLTFALAACVLAVAAHGQSTISEDDRCAWGANIGWINFRSDDPQATHGIRVNDTFLGGYAWAANVGWIDLGDGTPANNLRYANTNSTDFGVNHDGAGNLAGLGWAPNVGWINFGWAAPDHPDRPRFNLYTGAFSGLAWSANCGWINLAAGLRTESIVVTDTDGDGISDAWELEHTGGLGTLGTGNDADGDGRPDVDEYITDTDPLEANEGTRLTSVFHDPNAQFSIVEWTSRPTRVYSLLQCTNLADPVWIHMRTEPGSATPTTAVQILADQPGAFYRVQVKLPLVP